MRLAIGTLAIALLALLAPAPTSAVAAKNQQTAFKITIDAVARLEQFPTLPPDFQWDFHATGAIRDAGSVGGSGNEFDLFGKYATYVVLFTDSDGAFELYQPTGTSWPGQLLGCGNVTSVETTTKSWWLRYRWKLEGTLVGG